MAEPVLRKGSNDPAVRDLQHALRALGHDLGPIDGVFGDATEAAVKAFQEQREITVDGIVCKITWLNIDEADQSEPVLRLGSTGLPVRRAQKRMSLVGFDVGGVDGRYGPKSESAVKDLQQRFKITVDGVSVRTPGQSSTRWRTKDLRANLIQGSVSEPRAAARLEYPCCPSSSAREGPRPAARNPGRGACWLGEGMPWDVWGSCGSEIPRRNIPVRPITLDVRRNSPRNGVRSPTPMCGIKRWNGKQPRSVLRA
jgi:peptidoglycan hydrolase-like protein with peptidoglycan-binding domain